MLIAKRQQSFQGCCCRAADSRRSNLCSVHRRKDQVVRDSVVLRYLLRMEAGHDMFGLVAGLGCTGTERNERIVAQACIFNHSSSTHRVVLTGGGIYRSSKLRRQCHQVMNGLHARYLKSWASSFLVLSRYHAGGSASL